MKEVTHIDRYDNCSQCGKVYQLRKNDNGLCLKCRRVNVWNQTKLKDKEYEQKAYMEIEFLLGAEIVSIDIGHEGWANSSEIEAMKAKTKDGSIITFKAEHYSEENPYIVWD